MLVIAKPFPLANPYEAVCGGRLITVTESRASPLTVLLLDNASDVAAMERKWS